MDEDHAAALGAPRRARREVPTAATALPWHREAVAVVWLVVGGEAMVGG